MLEGQTRVFGIFDIGFVLSAQCSRGELQIRDYITLLHRHRRFAWHLQAADRISCDYHPKVFIYLLHSGSMRNNIGRGQNRSRKEVRDGIRRLIMGFRKECISAWLPSE